MTEIKNNYMTWQEFDAGIDEFLIFLDEYDFMDDVVVLGLSTGGLPTATTLSNYLQKPLSLVSFTPSLNPIFLEPSKIISAKKIIIPDNIYNTGSKVNEVIKCLVEDFGKELENIVGLFHFAGQGIYKTNMKFYRVFQPSNGDWCVFPWEQKEDDRE